MNNLKSAIADKVLDISALNGDDTKMKLEKINRFRDFVNACQSLIQKYPSIEDELLRMVESNDFDTRIASSRVDTIIRLSDRDREGENASKSAQVVAHDIEDLEKITEEIIDAPVRSESIAPISENISSSTSDSLTSTSKGFVDEPNRIGHKETAGYLSEESKPEDIDEDKVGQYVDFEEIDENTNTSTDSFISPVIERKPSIQIEDDNKKKDTAKKILQVCGIALIIVALIFIIKFVINNWVAILYGLGAVILVGGIVYFLLKRKNTAE